MYAPWESIINEGGFGKNIMKNKHMLVLKNLFKGISPLKIRCKNIL